MKLLRRALTVVALAGAVAGVLRVRGTGGTPPQHGGWRELDLDESPESGDAELVTESASR